MRRRRSLALASLVVAAATLLGAGCGDEEVDKLSVDDGPVESGNAITPEKLTARQGRTIEIRVTNTAKDKPHGFSIDAFNIKETVDQGKTTTVKFKADKAGTYQVYCQLHPTHKPAELTIS